MNCPAFTDHPQIDRSETLSPFTSTGQELVESAQDCRPEYPARSLDPTQGPYLGLSRADSATGFRAVDRLRRASRALNVIQTPASTLSMTIDTSQRFRLAVPRPDTVRECAGAVC